MSAGSGGASEDEASLASAFTAVLSSLGTWQIWKYWNLAAKDLALARYSCIFMPFASNSPFTWLTIS